MSQVARSTTGGRDPERRLRRRQTAWWCCASLATAAGLLCAVAEWGWRLPTGFGASTACVVAACGAPFLLGEGVGALSGLVRVAVQAGLVLPAVTGLMAALGVTGLVVTVLLAATHPRLWALARRHGLVGGALTSSSGDDPGMAVTLAPWDDLSSAVTEPETPAQLRALGDRELCLAWRRSFVRLNEAQTTMERLRVVEQRQGYLDELQRRSPDALASWLVSGARAPGNPLPYLRAHRHGSLRPRD